MRKIRVAICAIFVITCAMFAAYQIKTRRLEDHIPPTITCAEDTISVSVAAGDEELLQGVTAEDNRDGDITDSIRISGMSHFIEKGRRTITYIVFDEANQAGTAERTLIYTDYTSPKIYLSQPLRYTITDLYDVNFAENLTAWDCLDGDITNQIRISQPDSYYYEAGEYNLTVQVTNGAGDVCVVPMQIESVDGSDKEEAAKYYPMLSEYIVYTSVGNELNPRDYIIGVMNGETGYTFAENSYILALTAEDIQIESEVDYSAAGVYTVRYSYTTSEGIEAVTKLYVVVED